MRASFALSCQLILTALVAFMTIPASAADFKVTAPATWKKLGDDGGDGQVAIYQLQKSSSRERVVVRSFKANEADIALHTSLDRDLKKLVAVRSAFMNRFGLTEYNILGIEKRRLAGSSFPFMQIVHSRYVDRSGRDVQMIERQYAAGDKLYVISYQVDAITIDSQDRVERFLNYFEPVAGSRRKPASAAGEVMKAVGYSMGVARKNAISQYGQKVIEANQKAEEEGFADPDMSLTESQDLCSSVPVERRRTESDMSTASLIMTAMRSPGNCLIGVVDNLAGLCVGIWEIGQFAWNYATDEEFRSQTNMLVGAVAAEVAKDPVGFTTIVAQTLRDQVIKFGDTFMQCLKPDEQVQAICDLATNFIPVNIMLKLAVKVPLTAAESVKLGLAAKAALKAKLLAK